MCGRGQDVVLLLKETQTHHGTECKPCMDLQDKKTSKQRQDHMTSLRGPHFTTSTVRTTWTEKFGEALAETDTVLCLYWFSATSPSQLRRLRTRFTGVLCCCFEISHNFLPESLTGNNQHSVSERAAGWMRQHRQQQDSCIVPTANDSHSLMATVAVQDALHGTSGDRWRHSGTINLSRLESAPCFFPLFLPPHTACFFSPPHFASSPQPLATIG